MAAMAPASMTEVAIGRMATEKHSNVSLRPMRCLYKNKKAHPHNDSPILLKSERTNMMSRLSCIVNPMACQDSLEKNGIIDCTVSDSKEDIVNNLDKNEIKTNKIYTKKTVCFTNSGTNEEDSVKNVANSDDLLSDIENTKRTNDKNPLTFNCVRGFSKESFSPDVVQRNTACHKAKLQSCERTSTATCQELREQIIKRKTSLENRCARSLERLRRIQCRRCTSNAQEQIGGVVERCWRKRYLANFSTNEELPLANDTEFQPGIFDDSTCMDLDSVSGSLASNMRHLIGSFDADATESSSGGESCNEMDIDEENVPVQKRVEWDPAKTRSQIASKWTWLQAQVSDLEYRIRLLTEIYRLIRENKPQVRLAPITEPMLTDVAKAKDFESIEKLTTSNSFHSDCQRRKNGCVDRPLLSSDLDPPMATASISTSIASLQLPGVPSNASTNLQSKTLPLMASRCCPVEAIPRRPLLRTRRVIGASCGKRLLKPSTVHCRCQMGQHCVICGGLRGRGTSARADPCKIPYFDRVALLDETFHTSLSFPRDVPQQFQCNEFIRTNEFERKSFPSCDFMDDSFTTASKSMKSEEWVSSSNSCTPSAPHQWNLHWNLSRTDTRHSGSGSDTVIARSRKRKRFRESDRRQSLNDAVGFPMTPCRRRRVIDDQFDINNIVIPYNIAAMTRLERPQYKEILTPKWRVLSDGEMMRPLICGDDDQSLTKTYSQIKGGDDRNESGEIHSTLLPSTNPSKEFEDISNLAYANRHYPLEVVEKRLNHPTQTFMTTSNEPSPSLSSLSSPIVTVASVSHRRQSRSISRNSHVIDETTTTSSSDVATTPNASPWHDAHDGSTTEEDSVDYNNYNDDVTCLTNSNGANNNKGLMESLVSGESLSEHSGGGGIECCEVNIAKSGWLPREFPLDERRYEEFLRDASDEL